MRQAAGKINTTWVPISILFYRILQGQSSRWPRPNCDLHRRRLRRLRCRRQVSQVNSVSFSVWGLKAIKNLNFPPFLGTKAPLNTHQNLLKAMETLTRLPNPNMPQPLPPNIPPPTKHTLPNPPPKISSSQNLIPHDPE